MDLKQYLRVLRHRWWLVTLCAVAVLSLAAAAAWLQTPKYESHVKLFVSTKAGGDPTDTYNGGLFAQQRVKSYADIVSSDLVVSAVRKQLQLAESVKQLQKQITASAPADTVVIDVKVTDSSPTQARDIASAVGRQFTLLADQLETPQGQKLSAVKVTQVEPATLPGSPVSPNRGLYLILGLVVGLALGVSAAALSTALDSSVGTRHDAAEYARAPVLASLPTAKGKSDTPLTSADDYFSPLAEAFRQLRTNLRFVTSPAAQSLVVTSASAGEGKTTVAVNLAIAIARSGETVVLVDADLRRPQVATVLGLQPEVGLSQVLLGDSELDDALEPWPADPSLFALCAGPIPPNPSELVGSRRMRDLVEELLKRDVIVVLDTPPLEPATDAAVLSNFADGTLLVVRPGRTRREHLETAAEAVRQAGGRVLGVVLNRCAERG